MERPSEYGQATYAEIARTRINAAIEAVRLLVDLTLAGGGDPLRLPLLPSTFGELAHFLALTIASDLNCFAVDPAIKSGNCLGRLLDTLGNQICTEEALLHKSSRTSQP